MDTVGTHKGCDVIHICTKGGLNVIVKKSQGGAFTVLGQGPHRALSKHNADKTTPGIEWNDVLTKSESLNKATDLGNQTIDVQPNQPNQASNPQNHYDLAAHHSKVAGKHHAQVVAPEDANGVMSRNSHLMFNTDLALKHYQAAGLNPKQAMDEHKKQMNYASELPEGAQPPFSDHALQMSWGNANPGKRFPSGLNYDFKG